MSGLALSDFNQLCQGLPDITVVEHPDGSFEFVEEGVTFITNVSDIQQVVPAPAYAGSEEGDNPSSSSSLPLAGNLGY